MLALLVPAPTVAPLSLRAPVTPVTDPPPPCLLFPPPPIALQDAAFVPVKHAMVRVLLSLVEREEVLPVLVDHQVVSVLSSAIRPGIEGDGSKVGSWRSLAMLPPPPLSSPRPPVRPAPQCCTRAL